ncbi:hypothetical protein FisN_29Lh133 [Fistulifera solaris]|uniref:Uncharacterized protein n=1 Tax=Fistulifera solaris TaxID=1519565 RepID=A0A1Z5JMA9_FISSO|nr:hypothetical protein FisN_29Lh133 [Fistulifera solaris]|eukprot:GAX14911.1 hypothetical protein FisN_29Lh133 [Fistulifera solaris]
MKLLVLSLLISSSAAAQLQTQQQPSSRPRWGRQLHQALPLQRQLRDDGCTFDKLMNQTCHLWEFCVDLTFDSNVEVRCGGNIDADWYIFMDAEEVCYNDLPEELAQSTGSLNYCSREQGYLNFTKSALVYSEVTEIITAPVQGTLHEVYRISECDSSPADYYFGRAFCNDPCPYLMNVGGISCNGVCQECSDGRMVLNCADISPGLVERCDASDNMYIYQEYFNFFQEKILLEEQRISEEENTSEETESSEVADEASTATVRTKSWMMISVVIAGFALCC